MQKQVRNQRGRSPKKIFRPPWEIVLDIVQKILAHLRKLFPPPGAASSLRACAKLCS